MPFISISVKTNLSVLIDLEVLAIFGSFMENVSWVQVDWEIKFFIILFMVSSYDQSFC